MDDIAFRNQGAVVMQKHYFSRFLTSHQEVFGLAV